MSTATDKLVDQLASVLKSSNSDRPQAEREAAEQAVVIAAAKMALGALDDVRNAMLRQADATKRLVDAVEELVEVQKRRGH